MKSLLIGCCGKRSHKSLGLLLLRLGVGIVFIMEGWMKLGNMSGTVAFFAKLGFGSFLAYFVAWAELVGGILVVLGMLTGISGIVFAIILVVAVYSTHRPLDKATLEIALFFSSLALAFTGAGKYSVHKLMCPSCKGCVCASCEGERGSVGVK